VAEVGKIYPVAVRQPRTPPQWHDLQRLQEIRDQHAQLHQQCRQAGEAARMAKIASVNLRRDIALASPEASQLLTQDLNALQRLTAKEMADVKLDGRAIQRIAVAEHRVGGLQKRYDDLTARLSESNRFLERVEAYARRNQLDT
jgi:hypothetical protein